MVYPSAPWILRGVALQSLYAIDMTQVRPLIPPELEIVTVFPGKTLGGVYVARYEQGSSLEYSELIAVAAIVRSGWQWGGWISHIYVDNPDSVAGGREIWHLPKELATFKWQGSTQVTISQGNQTLCTLNSSPPSFGFPINLTLPAFSCDRSLQQNSSHLFRFESQFQANFSMSDVQLNIPLDSPLQRLGLSQSWLSLSTQSLNLRVAAPTIARSSSL